MLTVTDFAAAAIRHLLERSNASDGGLRIARASAGGPLKVFLAQTPAPEDTVVFAADGVRVYLDEEAAGILGDKMLDVTIGVRGRIEFFTTDARQPIEPGR